MRKLQYRTRFAWVGVALAGMSIAQAESSWEQRLFFNAQERRLLDQPSALQEAPPAKVHTATASAPVAGDAVSHFQGVFGSGSSRLVFIDDQAVSAGALLSGVGLLKLVDEQNAALFVGHGQRALRYPGQMIMQQKRP